MNTVLEYGEIKNVNTDYNGTDRLGDYGEDKDYNAFVYTKNGWKPMNPEAYEANYWKKKYEELQKSIAPTTSINV